MTGKNKQKQKQTLSCYGYFHFLKGRFGRSNRNVVKTVQIQQLFAFVIFRTKDNRGGSGHCFLDLSYGLRVNWEAL